METLLSALEGKEELGIPMIPPDFAPHLHSFLQWALQGDPKSARQVWFSAPNALDLRSQLQDTIKGRILPLLPAQTLLWLKRGPFDALVLPCHGFEYGNPNLTLSDFWRLRGSYEKITEENAMALWCWRSFAKPLHLFGLDHHHAVLWDVKQIVRPLGARLDFIWLCDGRPAVNEAIPSVMPGFKNSLGIYKPSPSTPLHPEAAALLTKYDGIVSSHSLVTAHRFSELLLPQIHVNSTRFGNEWIVKPDWHSELVKNAREMLKTNRLQIAHNNRGDQLYFKQFFQDRSTESQSHVYVPSLCESAHRIRGPGWPKTGRFLLWDTRQILLQADKSPFMKELYNATKENVDSQAILLAEKGGHLAEGYLDAYDAVIHIPYNVSTMSIFQQTRSNIPVWVPSAELLAKLWSSESEPNELSWCMFNPGFKGSVSALDNARDPDITKKWSTVSDFYYPETMGCVLIFNSIEELKSRLVSENYDLVMEASENDQRRKREEVFAVWEQMLKKLKGVP